MRPQPVAKAPVQREILDFDTPKFFEQKTLYGESLFAGPLATIVYTVPPSRQLFIDSAVFGIYTNLQGFFGYSAYVYGANGVVVKPIAQMDVPAVVTLGGNDIGFDNVVVTFPSMLWLDEGEYIQCNKSNIAQQQFQWTFHGWETWKTIGELF